MKRKVTKRNVRRNVRLPQSKDTMSPRDISRESGIGLISIYRLLQSGDLPSKLIGNRYYVSRAAYVRWLQRMGGGENAA